MKKYIYVPTWRTIWLDLAIKLKEKNIASPSIYLSSDINLEKINKHFKKSKFINFHKINKWNYSIDWSKVNINNSSLYSIIEDSDFREFKEKSINLMNRQDMYWFYRLIDRESIFYDILLYLFNEISNKKIDFAIFCEAPHSPATFITYHLSEKLWIKTYVFNSCSLAPIIFLRQSIKWDYLTAPKNISKNNFIEKNIDDDITTFYNKTKKNTNEVFEPQYMIDQKKSDLKKIKPILKNINWLYHTIIWNNNNTYFFSISWFNKKINLKDWILTYLLRKKYSKYLNKNLCKNSINYIDFNEKYVYFPLHYEPERTSNPEWGKFFNQIESIIALRTLLPNNIKIYVKEHYSQITTILQWFRWRSLYFYDIINKLENVYLIGVNNDSKKLIENSQFTCSLTWTAVIESVLSWKPWIFMWEPWYETLSPFTKFNNDIDIEKLINKKIDKAKTLELIKEFISDKWVFWTINPSEEKYYNHYYNNESKKNELDNLVKFISNYIK